MPYTTIAEITEHTSTPAITRSGGEVPADYYAVEVTVYGTVLEYLFPGSSWDQTPETVAAGAITRTLNAGVWIPTNASGDQLGTQTDRVAAFAAVTAAHADALRAGTFPITTGRPSIGERRMSFTIQPCGPDGTPINGGNYYANANTIQDANTTALTMLGSNPEGTYCGHRIESVEISGQLMRFSGHAWDRVPQPDARATHTIVRRPGPHFCNTTCYDTHATPWDRAGDAAELCQDTDHHQRYPDSTPESIRAHVRAHLAP